MTGIIDSLITTGIFTSVLLLPGFLSIFFPFKVLGIRIRYSNFELTLFSLLISILIFSLSVLSYQLFNIFLPNIVNSPLDLENITIVNLITNSSFVIIFIFYTLFFIFLGFFFMTKDRLQTFRRIVTGKNIIIKPNEYVWDEAFEDYPGYYHIIETNNDEIFFGYAIYRTSDTKEKELLLKYPKKYDEETKDYIKLEDTESILFLDADIRRVHFVKPKNKEEKPVDKNVKKIPILLIGLLIMLVSTILIHFYFKFFLGFKNDYIVSGFWVFSIFPLLIYLVYCRYKEKIELKDLGFNKNKIFKMLLLGLLSGIIIGLIGWIFIFLFGNPVSNLSNELAKLIFLRSVIFAPIYEEILVRGLLWAIINITIIMWLKHNKQSYSKTKKDIFLIVIVSFIFLFLHYDRNYQLLLTKFLFDSFAFSFVYYKTKNLITPIMAHSIANLFVLLQAYIF